MSPNNDTELPQASPPLSTIEDKPWDNESFKILETALRMQGVKKPLTKEFYESYNELQDFITTETTKARIDEWRLFLNGNTEPVVRETVNHLYARERLAQLTDMVATGLGQGEATQSRPVPLQKEQK